MPNRLINETSPYLLQHAHNPVDWYPWGPEALERAKAEDKPVLLSVGYSACHWCHVMERESFENPAIAEQMNENFVCIKVDREERPDVDSIYMSAVQVLSGHGGWPMTVFLTPNGEPFYGGTYFPPEDRSGMPGFPRVLEVMADTYKTKRSDVVLTTGKLVQQMKALTAGARSVDPLTADVLDQAYRGLSEQFDDKHGGTGMQPKFPQPMIYEFLLRYHLRTGNSRALEIVELTLDKMANGGIYDQIGGGFHRYSTDMFWLVPHFEKMLYDNALLVKLYVHGYQVTGKLLYRRVIEETLDYVLREMTDSDGGYYSAQDADSEGVEGKFFVWRPEEIIKLLGERDGKLVNRYFGVAPQGNFEGMSILSVVQNREALANESGMTSDEFDEVLERARAVLFEAREARVRPDRDNKTLTSWNGLMMQAFAEAGAVLGRKDYVEIARRNAEFLMQSLQRDGRLLRTYKDGQAKLNAYLEDYAFLISGLMSLHEATFEARWLTDAIDLGRSMVDLFWDEGSGVFYDTGRDHEELVLRPRDTSDNAIPSGSSMAADVLLRLAVITGDLDLEGPALATLRYAREMMTKVPAGSGHYLSALDFYLSTAKEIVIVGNLGQPDTNALTAQVHRDFIPNRVFIGLSDGDEALADLPLAQSRDRINGRATAYVCENYVCQLPVNTAEELAKQLAD